MALIELQLAMDESQPRFSTAFNLLLDLVGVAITPDELTELRGSITAMDTHAHTSSTLPSTMQEGSSRWPYWKV